TNAPGRIGDGATDQVIVDVPGAGGAGGEDPDVGAGEPAPGSGAQAPTEPDGQSESAVPGTEGTGDDTPVVAEDGDEDGRGEAVPGRVERTPAPAAVDPDSAGDGGEDPGGKLWLLLTGLAGAGAGAARFGRGRAPWAGKTGYVTIPKLFGEQTLFLMADEDSERMHRFDQPVAEGGRMEVLDDGSAVIPDADGAVVAGAGARAARFGRGRAPWAGKTGYVTIPKLFGEQTLFLMADEDSERMHRFDQPVPEGGRIEVLDDGSAVILDADGAVVATVAPP